MNALQITGKGMSFLNGASKRKVLIEKTKKLDEVDVVFEEINSQMLFVLDRMKDGTKRFRTAFKKDEERWNVPEGTTVIDIMLSYEFLKEVSYP